MFASSGKEGLAQSATVVLVASSDAALISSLDGIFAALNLKIEVLVSFQSLVERMRAGEGSGPDSAALEAVVLLDMRLEEVAGGQFLASMHDSGLRRRCAVAVIADDVPEDWTARLREGAIDDIVPRTAGMVEWKTRLSTMQRGHRLYCELEELREHAAVETQHDPVTGVFSRETMISVLFRETDRVQRLHGSLCVVAMAMDDFERRLRELGPEVCNSLMRNMAGRIGRLLRTYDVLGRGAGHSFLLSLPGCGVANATMLAERLRMDVFGETFTVKTEKSEIRHIRLTGCFGIVSSRGRSPLVVVREAEATLAQAIEAGPDAMRSGGEPAALSAASTAALFPAAELMF